MTNKSYKIEFTYLGKKTIFQSKQNPLNAKWMFTFDDWRSCFVANSLREIKTIIKNINAYSEAEN